MQIIQVPRAFLLALAAVLPSVAFAQFGGPELQSLTQLGCKVGQTIPSSANSVGQLLTGTSFELTEYGLNSDTIPIDADPGIYQVRAAGPNGLSNSRNFLVSSEAWSMVVGNESEVSPASIAPGTVWQDECPERGRNYYRVKVEQDQKLELQTFSYSLDSRARLVVSLLSSDHSTIATQSATHDSDVRLPLDLKANTEYILLIHDHLFRGGTDYRYAFKLSPTTSAETPDIVERWRRLCKQQRNRSNQPLSPNLFSHPRSCLLRPPMDIQSNIHDESNYPAIKPLKAQWPCLITGEINTNDDVDFIDLECEAKTDVSVELISQRLGEWTDGLVVIFRVENVGQPTEQLHRIAENDDGPAVGNAELRFANKDPMLTFQTTDKGTYRVQIRSQQRIDALRAVPSYALEIRKPNPGFVLSAHLSHPTMTADQTRTVSPTLCAGGAMMIAVHSMRFDNFAEPIELNLTGLPEGVRGGSGVIAKDQNFATLNLWNFGPPIQPQDRKRIDRLEVIGSVEIGQMSITCRAVPVEVTWNAIDTYRSPIAKVLQTLSMAKLDTVVCPLTIELGSKELDARLPIQISAVRGQPLKIPVRVTRRTGGEGVITVRLHHGPPKVTAAEIKVEPKATEGVLELQIPKDAPAGDYMVGMLCESAISVPNSDAAAKEKTKSLTLQLPSSNLRIRIGDAP